MYSLTNVHNIDGRKILDPKVFCQTHYHQDGTYIRSSDVILPVGCFNNAKKGVRQYLQVELWNLQKNVILDISRSASVNGFQLPNDFEGKLDQLWKSGSADDCRQFCFINLMELTFCDGNKKNESTFLCAFCIRNKFGKGGDQYMKSVCNYKGPMTLQEKLQHKDDSTEGDGNAVDTDNHPELHPIQPNPSPDFKSVKSGLSLSLILKAMKLPRPDE